MKKILLVLVIGLLLVSIVGYAKPFNKGPLTKITFIHYKKGFAGKPGTECGNGVCEKGENANKCWVDCGGEVPEPDSTCYDFISKGFVWKDLPQNYSVHPALEAKAPGAIAASFETWENATGRVLFDTGDFNDTTVDYDTSVIDGRNELSLGNYSTTGVIAVTVVWGYFNGPPKWREIVEFDIMFDIDFEWADCTAEGVDCISEKKMDLQNIATHEIGHGLGLDDLYETTCSAETMYGYSWEGDILRRDLNAGDLAGLAKLYG